MPTKKKSTVQLESDDVPVREPKKSLASIKSFKKETDMCVPKTGVSRVKARSTEEKVEKLKLKTIIAWSVIGVLLFVAVGSAIYFYRAYRQATDPKPVVNETEKLIARLSQFMELPQGEAPTLATVTDKTKLVGQDFFLKAENGDQVLIYQTAGKAILFRPSTGKIVNFAPVNTKDSAGDQKASETPQQDQTTSTESTQPAPASVTQQVSQEAVPVVAPVGKAKVALYNGSTTVGITTKVEKELATGLADLVEVVAKAAASKKDYEGVTVVDLSGARSQDASSIAGLLGGTVATALPDSEATPEGADIVVIIGNVKK
ncbi:MAG: hypothetical protein HGB34_02360 [Candidatus Moranbacteria bacterium]|nr:hypothetical protein [Candidatus Moranbacteria bacterium]